MKIIDVLFPGFAPVSYVCISGIAGIAYADGEYAVVLECDEVQEDGTCNPAKTVIEILSRYSTKLSAAAIQKLSPVAHQLCVEPSDFHLLPHDSE